MIIKNLEELAEAKRMVQEMIKDAKHPFVISVLNQMLAELEKGDVENVVTPSYLSIINFGYDMFKPLHSL